MNKYGIDNFHIEIIEECSNEELNQKEIEYIEKFNSYIPNGYNSTRGGDGVARHDYNEIVQRYCECGESATKTKELYGYDFSTIRNALASKGLKCRTRQEIFGVPVYECDINNNILKKFNNYQEVVDEYPDLYMNTDSLGNYLSVSRTNCYRGKYFCRVSEYEHYKTINHHNKSYIPIICIETNEEFESISAAGRWINKTYLNNQGSMSTIMSKIRKALKTGEEAYNFNWKKIEY